MAKLLWEVNYSLSSTSWRKEGSWDKQALKLWVWRDSNVGMALALYTGDLDLIFVIP